MKLFLLLIGLVVVCRGRPNGAPAAACPTMMPNHGGNQPRTDPAPYEIIAGNPVNGQITVTLRSTTPGRFFRGFLINAINTQSQSVTGSFIGLPSASAQSLSCFGPQDSATHVSNNDKSEVQLTWISDSNGPVRFRATFVEMYSSIYLGVSSQVVTV